MTATRLDLPPAEDHRIARLEARQKELYGLLAELRSSHAPRERIRALILEVDEHDARVEAARALPPAPPLSELTRPVLRLAPPAPRREPGPAPPPDPADDEEPSVSLKRILIVGAVIVAAAAVVAVLASDRATNPPTAHDPDLRTVAAPAPPPSASPPVGAAGFVPVQLHTHLATTPCSRQDVRTALRWTWTLPAGFDGQQATIEATGPGLAATYSRKVVQRRVGLTYTSPCLAPGATWTVSLERVGGIPARLTDVEQEP